MAIRIRWNLVKLEGHIELLADRNPNHPSPIYWFSIKGEFLHH